ncbi:MAG: hypothetical protein ACK5LZ_06785, partial [Anaerorhabdus sp.]
TRAETNSTVNASGIELLYAEIIEESEGKLEYYRNKEGLIVSDVALDGYISLTATDIEEWNAFNRLVSILLNTTETKTTAYAESSFYYVTEVDYNHFNGIKFDVLQDYSQYAGREFASLYEIFTENNGLIYESGSLLGMSGISTRTTTEQIILNNYATQTFYNEVKSRVQSQAIAKFFTPSDSSKTMVDFNGEFTLFLEDSVALSDEWVEEYELMYGEHLQKLTDDSALMIANYDNAVAINTTIIESGKFNLEKFESMNKSNQLVVEENEEISEHISGIKDNNATLNETVQQSEESYLESVSMLEENNTLQEGFVEEYAQILNYANVDGVSNNRFYSFVTEPISYDRTDVNEGTSATDIYFILLWLMLGITFINVMKDVFPSFFGLSIENEDFSENRMISFLNKYLIYGVTLVLFALVYTIVLIFQFKVVNTVAMMIQLPIIILLIGISMRAILQISRMGGYGFIVFITICMYVLLQSADTSALSKLFSLPWIALSNYIKMNVYQLDIAYAFLYSLIVYGGVALITVAIAHIVNHRNAIRGSGE